MGLGRQRASQMGSCARQTLGHCAVKIYIGHDDREQAAVDVALRTLLKVSGIEAELLCADRLRDAGMLSRITDHRGGKPYDLISNAHKSTAFAVSRFMTPLLCQGGWALFTDCDVVFLRDPREMLGEIDPGKAVYVVKHDYTPSSTVKMDGQVQAAYAKKNWSSVALYDTSHAANRRLSLHDINTRPGRDLHAFYWLAEEEIGALDPAWNWLVDEQPRPENLAIAHLTTGGPWVPDWEGGSFDAEWLKARNA